MSIQLPMILFSEGEEVLRLTCVGGYASLNPDASIVRNALWVAEMGREFYPYAKRQPFPEFDRLVIIVGERRIEVKRYTGMDSLYRLEKAGEVEERLVAQAMKHRDVLADLPETQEISQAIAATDHFIERIKRKIAA